MSALWPLTRRHPTAVDAGAAALIGLANTPSTVAAGVGVTGWLFFVALHLPLSWRRQAPVVVFWTVSGLAVASWMTIPDAVPYPAVVVLAAVYTVVRHRPWRRWWLVVAAVQAAFAAGCRWSGLSSADLGVLSLSLVGVVLAGAGLRTRQAYLDERAEHGERERDQRARLAVAAERARIAREMHDVIAHNLSVMVALADGASLAPQRATETLTMIAGTGRQALGEMQRLLGVFRDGDPEAAAGSDRAPQPGLDDLDTLVRQVRAAGLDVVLHRDGEPGAWGSGAGLTVYRLVQEALTNALKHAGPGATTVVRLHCTAGGAEVEIVDDGGNPRPPDDAAGGRGLAGMAERAAAYGGRVEAGPLPDGTGWRVHVRLSFATER